MTIEFNWIQSGPSPSEVSNELPGAPPTLLFLHGFMGSVDDWKPVIQKLDSQFFCWAIDLPGHGKTNCDNPQDYAMEKTGQAIANFLSLKNLTHVIPIGYSMGGRIALYCALSFPQRFPQAVIESGSPGLRKYKDRETRRNKDFDRSCQITTDFLNFLEGWYEQPLFTTLKKFSTGFVEMKQRRLNNNPAGLATSLRQMGLGSQPNLWNKLESHPNPLLLLTGELDQKFTRLNQEMDACCDAAVHSVVSGAGHNIHLENPAAIATAICQWLTDD